MLREAATGPVIGGRKGYAGDNGPAIEAWLDTPGGIAVAPNGDVYFADSNNHVIRRIDAREQHRRRSSATTSSAPGSPATTVRPSTAQLDTPDGVAIAPDGDLIVADSHNDRIRRVDRQTGVITTIAGSGENGYDGDEQPAIEAALNTPSAVAAAPNGDIYIADTLNYRVRMIDARDRPDPHDRRRRHAGRRRRRRRRRAGDQRAPEHAERRRDRAERRHLHRRHAPQPRAQGRREDAHHHDRRRQRRLGQLRRRRPGDRRRALAGPAGIAVVPEPDGKVTIFIADYYNGRVRAVGPDGIIRDVERRGARRVRRADARRLRAADAAGSTSPTRASDRLVPLIIPTDRAEPGAAPPRRRRPPTGRSADDASRRTSPSLLPWTLSFLRPYRGARGARCRSCCSSRSRSARCSRGRSRSSSTTCSSGAPLPEPFAGWLPAMHGGNRSRCWSSSSSPACCCRSSNQLVSALRHAGAGRHRAADGLRPARPAVRASAGARPAPSHHDEHRRRGLPRRRRRLLRSRTW